MKCSCISVRCNAAQLLPSAQAFIKNVTTGKLSKGDKLGQVDHATMNYPPFRRNFYIEVPELARLSEAEVVELRKQLDDVKVIAVCWACLSCV